MKSWAIGVLVALILIIAEIAAESVRAEARGDPDTGFLDAMAGDWIVTGTTLGKPIKYTLHGQRVLAGGFVRLDLVDTNNPLTYQADVYLSYDRKKNDYIMHWLDQFGAAGARAVGEGRREGESLVIDIPYADGAFRDTFTYDPNAKRWRWRLEAQDKNGKWSTFANYNLSRR